MRSLLVVGLSTLALCSSTPPVVAQSYCQTNLECGGPGTSVLSVCGDKLALGNSATLLFTGGPPDQPADLIMGTMSNPVAHAGGTLVPYPPTVTPITLDGTGSYSMVIPGGGGPATIVAQVTYEDLTLPAPSIGFSNAVEIYLLPSDRPLIKMVFALAKYPDSQKWPQGYRSLAEAEDMKNALIATLEDNSYDQLELDIQIAQITMPQGVAYYAPPDTAYKILQDVEAELGQNQPDLLAGMDYLVVHSEKLWGGTPQGLGGFNGKYVLLQGCDKVGAKGCGSVPLKPVTAVAQHLMFHELGHTWGLNHCGAKGVEGSFKEYGHPFDPMGGNAQDPLHFHGWSKMQMGWVPTENVLEVDQSTQAGTMAHLMPINDPRCAVSASGTAMIVLRQSAHRDWLIYNHVDPLLGPQALVVRIPHTEKSPTLLTGSHAFASGDNSILFDQTPTSPASYVQSGIPLDSSFQTQEVTIENVGTLCNDEILLRIIPEDTAQGYAQGRVPNFVIDHSQVGQLFVSGPVEFTALDVIAPAASQITSFEFEIFGGGDGLASWLRGTGGKPPVVASSGPISPGVFPNSPEPGNFRWIYDTTTILGNRGYAVVGSASSANGTARRRIPIMVDNTTP